MGADATRTTSADVRRLVAYSTGQAYLAVYAQKLVIEVDETARDNARSHAAYTHQRYAGGVGNSIDEVRAIQEAASDEALVQQAYALLASDQEALGIVAGLDQPLDAAQEPVLADPPSLQEALDLAVHRPDVEALDLRSRAARKTVDDDWSDFAPYLSGVAQPFYQNPATPTVPLGGYSLGLLLTVKLNNWKIASEIPGMFKHLEAMGMVHIRAAQLAHDRQELFIYALTRKGSGRIESGHNSGKTHL